MSQSSSANPSPRFVPPGGDAAPPDVLIASISRAVRLTTVLKTKTGATPAVARCAQTDSVFNDLEEESSRFASPEPTAQRPSPPQGAPAVAPRALAPRASAHRKKMLASGGERGLLRGGPRPPNGALSICKDGRHCYDHPRQAGHAPGPA